MKVRVKELDDLKRIAIKEYDKELYFPEQWDGMSGDCPGLVDGMRKHCGMIIDLDDFDGWLGGFGHYNWSLPMFNIIKEHNRNGANV